MLQNIDLLSSRKHVRELGRLGKLTCTTAHEKYSTPKLRQELGVPLHKLSVHISPEQYERKPYNEKDNLMIVSPDKHLKKKEVLDVVARCFPDIKIQVISNLTYEEYKQVISKARWSLTFGEGLDGYFVETVFSGGISFSVYNSRFFTEDFRSLRTVYQNYDVLIRKICKDIIDLGDEGTYSDYQNRQFDLCHKYYDYKEYLRNLESFYREDYTYK
jgi:hypothetical protein